MSIHPFSAPQFALAVVLFGVIAKADETAGDVDFDAQIRPILSDKCFHCHGPDEENRASGLRLDTLEGALSDLGGYAAVSPGEPAHSELIARIMSDDEDSLMPPPDSKISLTEREKGLLEQWIAAGAEWDRHWAFDPPVRPSVPKPQESSSDHGDWARNPIDSFVLKTMQMQGISPNEPADPHALIRRLAMDLTGLPPSEKDLQRYLSDPSEANYEAIVDSLLASTAYGQRMAWDWLDAARYADTDGFQGDPTRSMWPWRDWLVDALNENMPFDKFTVNLLAGDLLPNATQEQALASGFNRNHMFNGEGGRIAEETRVENVFDRAETTSTVWLGLTMTCCRCHDHKYDPISVDEYFQFYAFFNNTSESGRSGRGKTAPVMQYLKPATRATLAKLENSAATLEKQMSRPVAELDVRQSDWESELRKRLADEPEHASLGAWMRIGPTQGDAKKMFDDDSFATQPLDVEDAWRGQKWTVQADQQDGQVIDLPAVTGVTYFARKIETLSGRDLKVSLGSDDGIQVYLNGKRLLSKLVYRAAKADQELLTLKLRPGSNDLIIKITNTGGIGGFYFSKKSESVLGLPSNVASALASGKPSTDDKQVLREYFRSQHWSDWKTLASRREALNAQIQKIESQATTVMVMDDLPSAKRRTTLILEKGGYDKPTDQAVTTGTPAALPPLNVADGRQPNRLDLAQWLVSPENPLTARVTVNRYWQTFFGRGIVESAEDFGVQGTRPTHPELLDWLAIEFMESGWDVKALHKRIVMSRTYRQSASVSQEHLEQDPQNVYLARSPRYRWPAWMLRDQALAAGGLLNDALGGRSVKPYQPTGIWAEATFGKIKYDRDGGDMVYRRSLYVFWRRIVGPTMFFDTARRQTCEVKPSRTNTPLHALTTLNETAFFESARGLALRSAQFHDDVRLRIEFAFRRVLAREADDLELELLQRQYFQSLEYYQKMPDAADQLSLVGQLRVPPELSRTEHAALTLVCSSILNLDETLTRP